MRTRGLVLLSMFALMLGPSAEICRAQSFEFMAGRERLFLDVQWLRAFDAENRWTLFSRTRATIDYEDNTNLFSGAYLNFTMESGVGLTILGKAATTGAGGDIGVHLFKRSDVFVVFALLSVGAGRQRSYNWFSIARFTPRISENWRLYSSLELFTSMIDSGHAASVQRLRLGIQKSNCQGGVAVNLAGLGPDYSPRDVNPGIFVRVEF